MMMNGGMDRIDADVQGKLAASTANRRTILYCPFVSSDLEMAYNSNFGKLTIGFMGKSSWDDPKKELFWSKYWKEPAYKALSSKRSNIAGELKKEFNSKSFLNCS